MKERLAADLTGKRRDFERLGDQRSETKFRSRFRSCALHTIVENEHELRRGPKDAFLDLKTYNFCVLWSCNQR
jgi:hypothetical protein